MFANDAEWVVEAACRETDPELFFPEFGDGMHFASRAAKQICAGCPVQQQCLAEAVRRNERYGIWGGVNFGQKKVRSYYGIRYQRPVDCGTSGGEKAHRRRGEQPCRPCMDAANLAARERHRRREAM